MKTTLLICVLLFGSCYSYPKSIPKPVVRELEMMFGEEFDINVVGRIKNPFFDAYKDVEFELYTQKNPEKHQRVIIDNFDSLKASNFNPQHPTRLIIHGAKTNGSSESIQYPKAGYMKKGEFNVFGVNWSKGAKKNMFLLYEFHMRAVGKIVGKFIEFLIHKGGASMDDMGVIGHSAGAITVSFVGKALNGTLPVLISLDPPKMFTYFLFKKHLPEKTDAKYVEVLHTSAGEGSPQDRNALGHADFYPNGGRFQPVCNTHESTEAQNHCNHMIAIDYFAESIHSLPGFWSKKCTNFENITKEGCIFEDGHKKMGGEPIDITEGIYFLTTNSEPPFAKGWIE